MNKFLNNKLLSEKELISAMDNIILKTKKNLHDFNYKFPYTFSKNNVYTLCENDNWTTGFWSGILWLVYEYTKDENLLKSLEIITDSFEERLKNRVDLDDHDVGFVFSLSSVAGYKVSKNERFRKTAIEAARLLTGRYRENGKFIQAWGEESDLNNYRLIIDCMLNIPLLFWAYNETGERYFYDIAFNHLKTTSSCIMREDNSVYHTYFINRETGLPDHGETVQGYSDDSAWSRGQAWAVYGFTLAYRYTKDENSLEMAKKAARFFIERLPNDNVPYWDLIFTSGDECRDSSAGAIVSCGLLEIIKYMSADDPEREIFEKAAHSIMRSLIENYSTASIPESNGLIIHGVYPRAIGNTEGVDECTIFGDYFYTEAIVRLIKNDWNLYW